MATLTVTIDCRDPVELAEFWRGLLGYEPVGAVGQYASIGPADATTGPKLVFQAVDEPKMGKNRLHIDVDLEPGAPLEPEVQRAVELGATVVIDGLVEEFGLRWQVLADPEGNEFCIVAQAAG